MPKTGFILPPEGARKIKDVLKKRGISQEVFAPEYLEVSDRTLRNWLSGTTRIDEHNLEKLLMHIGIGVEDVFGNELPGVYRDKSTLSRLIANFRRLVLEGDIAEVIKKYKGYLESLAEHVSFHRIPERGPFFTFVHDETHAHRYAHIEVVLPEGVENATLSLSFQFLKVVRVTIGHIVVNQDSVTATPFFQKYPHTVERDKNNPEVIHFAMWFASDPTVFFVESLNDCVFEARLSEMLTEQEYAQKEREIAVFWKGVWH